MLGKLLDAIQGMHFPETLLNINIMIKVINTHNYSYCKINMQVPVL